MDGQKYLIHYGVPGMKWGHRKQRPVSNVRVYRHSDQIRNVKSNNPNNDLRKKKIKKAVKYGAIAAGTLLAAYGAYKLHGKYVRDISGRVIKSNRVMQRISRSAKEPLNRTIYVTTNKSDSSKYLGLFGNNLSNRHDVYKVKMKAKGDIKVAPKKKAAETFSQFYKKDPEFKKWVDGGSNTRFKSDKEILTKGYENFNRRLVRHDPESNKQARKMYKALQKQGYDAIDDIFDQKYAYKTKAATIVFNHNKIAKESVEKVTKDELTTTWGKESIKKLSKPTILAGSTITAGIIGGKTVDKKKK